jgi:hypothetical protein
VGESDVGVGAQVAALDAAFDDLRESGRRR